MRLQGFKCDRCGKVVTDQDYCKLSNEEVGKEFLDDFPEFFKMELCDDCYEEFRHLMRDSIGGYFGTEVDF